MEKKIEVLEQALAASAGTYFNINYRLSELLTLVSYKI